MIHNCLGSVRTSQSRLLCQPERCLSGGCQRRKLGSLVSPREAHLKVQEVKHKQAHRPSFRRDGAQSRGLFCAICSRRSRVSISSIHGDSGNKFLQLVWQGRKSRLKLCVPNLKIIFKIFPQLLILKASRTLKFIIILYDGVLPYYIV